MAEAKKEASFEENIVILEGIVKELETGSCTLEDAMDKFAEGMKLIANCSDKLKNAREQVNKILGSDGSLEDFTTPEDETAAQ